MTNLEKKVKAEIIKFSEKLYKGEEIIKIAHIYPRCYVLGRPSSGCLLIAKPPIDSKPHCIELGDGSDFVYNFDNTLKAGDWCSAAYVSSSDRGGTVAVRGGTVAISAVKI